MTSPDPAPPLPPPPAHCGIDIEETDRGTRVTLPRRYTTGDLMTTAVAAAIAVWMAVWLNEMSTDPAGSTLGVYVLAAVGLFFAVLAVRQAFPIAARPAIEDRGDRLTVGRALGVRMVGTREIARSDITLVDRVRDVEAGVGLSEEQVRIKTGDAEVRIGKGLSAEAVEWLEAAVRRLAGRE